MASYIYGKLTKPKRKCTFNFWVGPIRCSHSTTAQRNHPGAL